jgi:hypothetical protein
VDLSFVSEINSRKKILRMFGNLFQIYQVAGICQAVQIDQLAHFRPFNDVLDDIRADETRATRYKQIHADRLAVNRVSGCHWRNDASSASVTGRMVTPVDSSFETSRTQLERGVWAATR